MLSQASQDAYVTQDQPSLRGNLVYVSVWSLSHWRDSDLEVLQMAELMMDLVTENNNNNIRIYHECEGRTEKSVLRITIWHHEACRVMTNGDPEGHIFLPSHK